MIGDTNHSCTHEKNPPYFSLLDILEPETAFCLIPITNLTNRVFAHSGSKARFFKWLERHECGLSGFILLGILGA